MIFVTVGTNEAPFDRLLHLVDELGVGAELVVQHGASSVRPTARELHDFVPFEDVVANMKRAEAVVTHAGIGSVMVALNCGKHPIAVPRLQRHGEAVDDHQLDFGRRFASAGLLTLVETREELERALAAPAVGGAVASDGSPLAAELRGFIASAVGP